MTLDNATRQSLKTRAHHLKSTIHVGRDGVTDPILAMIRGAFGRSVLIKVRIRCQSAGEAEDIAKSIAAAVPCELVARTGYVAVFYRIVVTSGASGAAAEIEGDSADAGDDDDIES